MLTLQAWPNSFTSTTRKRIVARARRRGQVRDLLAISFRPLPPTPMRSRRPLQAPSTGRCGFWDGFSWSRRRREHGCTIVLSEDMQDGARFGGVTILDPFVGEELPERVAELLR